MIAVRPLLLKLSFPHANGHEHTVNTPPKSVSIQTALRSDALAIHLTALIDQAWRPVYRVTPPNMEQPHRAVGNK